VIELPGGAHLQGDGLRLIYWHINILGLLLENIGVGGLGANEAGGSGRSLGLLCFLVLLVVLVCLLSVGLLLDWLWLL